MSIKQYLPSKNFIIALSTAIGVILIVVIFNNVRISKVVQKNLASNATSSIFNNNIDTDSDGLPDWKENLYSTNPNKADTDGDGTLDGEEVSSDRDPLLPNTAGAEAEPTDKIDPALIEADKKAISDYENLSPTEKMSRGLMSNVLANQPTSGNMSQDTVNSIVSNSFQEVLVKKFTASTTEADLNLIELKNGQILTSDLSVYKKIYFTQTEALRKIMGQDLSIMDDALSNEKDIDSASMKKIISSYKTIINSLIEAPLPAIPGSSGSIYHLAIINSLEKIIAIDNDILNSSNDMASIYADILEYNNVEHVLIVSLSNIDTNLGIKRN